MTKRIIAGAAGLLILTAAAAAQPPSGKLADLTKATADAAGGSVAGDQVYVANCAACHQPAGQGIAGAFPALAKDPFVTGDPEAVVQTLLNGRGGMPSFRDGLNDAQLAAVITHIRTSWGNKAKPVPVALVAKARAGKEVKTERPMPVH